MGYILTESEYAALDKALTGSLLYDNGVFIYQDNKEDYIGCTDKETVEGYTYREINSELGTIYLVPILEFLPELDSIFIDFEECYGFTKEDMKAYEGLIKKTDNFIQDIDY